MFAALLRDASVGQFIRFVTRSRWCQYPEERAEFQIPAGYSCNSRVDDEKEDKQQEQKQQYDDEKEDKQQQQKQQYDDERDDYNDEKQTESDKTTARLASVSTANDNGIPLEVPMDHRLYTVTTLPDHEGATNTPEGRQLSKIMSRPEMESITSRGDLEAAYSNATKQESLKTQPSRLIVPERTFDGFVLVDWYTTDDADNPQNWSSGKKYFVIFQIYLYTLAVYIGSAIFTPSAPYIVAKFGVSAELASMGLSLYVAGYGIGPLLFSPMSEIPIIGRNPPYIVTLGIFLVISIITAVIDNFPALLVLRFLQGFFGSPILATGGATIGDIFSLLEMPYFLTGWAAFATAGPALGPLISGFSVPHTNWHWSMWEIVWLAAPVWVSLLFFLPETSASNILLRRAKRLRKLTGNTHLKAQSEIDQAQISINEIVVSNLWRPLQINALDPAVLFTSLYTALMYAIFYSFFEVFPFVYGSGSPRAHSPTHGYGMNAGEIGLIFLSISVGVAIAIAAYIWYLKRVFEPEIRTLGHPGPAPERRLVPGLYATFLLPIGLFLLAWTGFNSPRIHWIVPTMGIAIVTIGMFILFQCIFIYIPLTYPQYAASLFAGNDFARSSLAAGAIHFSRPMFLNLGVGPGVSLLAGLTFGGIIGIYVLYFFGANLRARSRFAV